MRDLQSLARRQEAWRLEQCINLIPSENVTSPQVRALLASDFGHRYSLPLNTEIHGSYVENAYRGTRYLDEMESLGEEVARQLLGADYATLKPLSGHISGLVTLMATCRPGDRLLTISAEDGGYDGYGADYLPKALGLGVDFLPFDRGKWNLQTEEACRMIEEVRPRLVVVGASFILFPYELGPLRKACDASGPVLAYDASHVMGLIAGGVFQRPLEEGADIILGSTHKSLFGPQGGLIAARKELAEPLGASMTWKALDNAHWNRIAALTQALLEAERFGKAYAEAVVANARRLATELDKRGIDVLFADAGYTRSPQVLLNTEAVREGFGVTMNELAARLEKSNIIVDAVGRLGTNEVTRMGATEEDMADIAECMARCAQGEDVTAEVAAIRQRLKLSYVFEES
jgi:glycine hydroxymethyltransferase